MLALLVRQAQDRPHGDLLVQGDSPTNTARTAPIISVHAVFRMYPAAPALIASARWLGSTEAVIINTIVWGSSRFIANGLYATHPRHDHVHKHQVRLQVAA